MIEITEVRVSLRNDEKLKAFVSITLNDSFVIRGLKIIRGNSGLFVAMPSRKRPDGQHQDLAAIRRQRTCDPWQFAQRV